MEEEDFSKLPIEERCTHKVWKARLSGYEAAATLFRQIDDEKSPEWNKYMGMLKKFVVDSNAPAQEKGLEAVLAFIENCASAGRTAGDVLAGLVQKCLSAPKARTKELSAQIILMYVEIEKQEIVLEELTKGTESKNPKIVSASIHIITQALSEFGAKSFNVSKMVKRVPKLLEDRDSGVRLEAKLLLVEMFKWLGPAIKPQLTGLKPVQVTEMEAEFDKVKDVHPGATRLLRSQLVKKEQEVRDGGDDEGDGEDADDQPEEINPYDLLEAVDILSQIPKDFYAQLESKKWSERKDALEGLEKLLIANPKIENGDYGDLIRVLKKIITKDLNIVVVGVAVKCVTALANGLRKKFHQYALAMISVLIEKFKEKRQNIVYSLREAVDAIFPSTTLGLMMEDIIASLDNKNPSIKSEVAFFLSRCFAKSTPAVLNKKLLNPLSKSLIKCLGDQDPAVRDNAAQALGTAMKAAGEKNISPFLVDLDNQKLTKIKECCDKAEILVKPSKPEKVAKSAGSKAGGDSKPKPVVRPKGANVAKPKAAVSVVSLSPSEWMSKAYSLMDPSIISGLQDSDFELRLNAHSNFVEKIKCCKVNDETGQILLHVLHSTVEDTNVEMNRLKLQAYKFIADTMPINVDVAALLLPDVASLISSPECSEDCMDALWSFTSALSLDTVACALLQNARVLEDAKVWAGVLNWVSSAIMKTGVTNPNFIIECGKNASSQSDPAVKYSGLALIGTVHLQGPINADPSSEPPQIQKDTYTRPAKSASCSDLSKRLREKPQPTTKSAGSRKKEDDIDTSPLLQENNLKHQRVIDEQKLKTLKWNFTTPRSEFIDMLKDQMLAANVNKTLIANMFHLDFKYHLRAIDSLTEDLPNNRAALMCNLDLILRWMTIRFFDTNPTVLLKGLEYLITVFGVLIEEDYNMLDFEASAFFPYLILKVGDPKDKVRISVRTLFKQIESVYPVTKQFVFLIEGVKSKNARQRAECLEQMTWLINNYGLNVCHPSPPVALKEIAKNISDRDTSVRNAALNFIVAAHFLEGEKILKMVSQISEKDFCLLTERLKHANKNRPIASVKPLLQSAPREQIQEPPEPEIQDEIEEEVPQYQQPPVSNLRVSLRNTRDRHLNKTFNYEENNPELSPEEVLCAPPHVPARCDLDQNVIEEIECVPENLPLPQSVDVGLQFLQGPNTDASVIKPIQMPEMTPTLMDFTKPTAINFELAQIASSDIEKAMASIMQIDIVLNSENRTHLSGFIDDMVQQLVHQLNILNQSTNPEVVNGYRANFQLLINLCNYPLLCNEIQEATLYEVISRLLFLLAEQKLDSVENGENFNQVVNALVLKLLKNTNRTNILCALIKLLYDTMNNSEASEHYQDLVIKSLWDLNRMQQNWDHELDYARVLIEFHCFFRDFPTYWRKRREVDVPLRAIKNILRSMVRIRGVQVKDTLKNIPSIHQDSELVYYVDKIIQKIKQQGIFDFIHQLESLNNESEIAGEFQRDQLMLLRMVADEFRNLHSATSTTSLNENDPNIPNTHVSNLPSVPQRVPRETQEEISEIFRMLCYTELTQEGLKRLYKMRKSYPDFVDRFIGKTIQVFQQYILNGLASIEKQHADEANSSFAQSSESHPTDNAENIRLRPRRLHLKKKVGCVKKQSSAGSQTIAPHETGESKLKSIKERLEIIKTNIDS